jgi:hypothetical protein
VNGKWLYEPKPIVRSKKPDYAFPTKKSVKAMTFSIENCSPRYNGDWDT